MAKDNNITTYTSADIEKYHSGALSPQQMNAMERAALDDPFLADALEGYSTAGKDLHSDLDDLRDRLKQKTARTATVIPMEPYHPGEKAVSWLRIAVMIVLIAGAGLLANQFLFNKTPGDIAQTKPVDEQQNTSPDTVHFNNPSINNPSAATENTDATAKVQENKSKKPGTNNPDKENDQAIQEQPAVASPVSTEIAIERKQVQKDETGPPAPKKTEAAVQDIARNDQSAKTAEETISKAEQEKIRNRAIATNRNAANNYRNTANTFRGRVTDNSRAGVPFANVTNVDDNVGTYTDANGYFNLTSPDSILEVQVRSIGFENTVTQLRNDIPANEVVLQEDNKELTAVVLQKQKPNAASRAQNRNLHMEESEPADGWDNYDSYLANNLKAPEEFKSTKKPMGSVELSFELDKNGEPVSFKIEKSLCASCDREAIRLVKEGPKWKKNATTKGRTRVTVNF